MTDQRSITALSDLIEQLESDIDRYEISTSEALARAYAAGADQQLEQDAKWLDTHALFTSNLTITPPGDALRKVMRPKPPSLKEQALAELAEWENVMDIAPDSPIRRALEQLDD
jgi:hypothetical protein